MKILIIVSLLIISTSLFAKSVDLSDYISISSSKSEITATKDLKDFIENGRYIRTEKGFIVAAQSFQEIKKTYERGDFVIMWALGAKDEAMTQNEYTQMWRIMKYLAGLNFRVILNVETSVKELKDAVERSSTAAMIISAHGNTDAFYDYDMNPVPYDIFTKKSKNLYQVVISACYGTQSRDKYIVPNDLLLWTWSGLTSTTDLMAFLVGNDWDVLKRAN